ncbi:MAG: gliding motility-associated C-terminal domain-containing protein [Bacteroidetes bacterium]|nr:gliding motility-associated C-terminal domain-containing protein [Bacteroidota bacterium]
MYLKLAAIIFVISSTALAQQTQNPYQMVFENLIKDRKINSNTGDRFGGLIGHPGDAPKGKFISSLTADELKAESTFFKGDTLVDFPYEATAKQVIADNNKLLFEFKNAMLHKQIAFVKAKYGVFQTRYEALNRPTNSSFRQPSTNYVSASACSNIDFEDGNFGGWNVQSGYNTNSNTGITIAGPGYTNTNQSVNTCYDANLITSAYGTDPIGGFPGLDPSGGTTSARLGGFPLNTAYGYFSNCPSSTYWSSTYSNGEVITKTITVSSANALLNYDYAVILNDGGHGAGQQPYFHVYIKNTSGVVLSSCTEYSVQAPAGSAPPGFTNSGYSNSLDGSIIYYKNWTSNSINLTPYIGQQVVVNFEAAGCTQGAHPGYAYVDAICSSAQINISNTSACVGTSVILTAPAVVGGSYYWSGPGVTGQTTRTVSVNTAGAYNVVVTPSQGPSCNYTLSTSVSFVALPVASASAPSTITCSNPNVNLSGTGGGTYAWSGTGIVSGANTSNPVVNGPGPFSLTVTSSAGCTSTNVATVSVPVNTTQPGPLSITSASVLNCYNSSIVLNGSPTSGITYTWSGPGVVSGGNSANPTVNAGGTYVMNVTSTSNGCTNSTSYVVAPSNTTVNATASTGGSVTCNNNTITLSAGPASMSYTWVAPSGASILSGNNSSSAIGQNSGTYTVTVFNPSNGCTQKATVSANINLTAPTATASSSGVINCTNTAINLNVNPSGLQYNWSAGGGGVITSGATNQSATGSGNGTYSVVVTNPVNGCSVTKTVAVTVNTTVITPSSLASPGAITCSNPNTTLVANPTSGVSYMWTGPGGFTSTAQNPVVGTVGFYTLVVTNNSNGCASASNAAVAFVSQNLTTPTLSALSQTASLICGAASTTVSGSANPSGSSPTWLGGVLSGGSTYTATIGSPGTYTLVAAHPVTGCTTALTYTVIPDLNTPNASLSQSTGTITCTNTLVGTTGNSTTSPVSYQWAGSSGIVGATNNPAVSVNAPGNYTLTVTNTANNCKSTLVYNVSTDNAPVTPTVASSATITCNTLTSNISSGVTAPGTYTYSWSGPSSFNSTAQSYTTSVAGVYNVTVTNVNNGCVGMANVTVVTNTSAPTGLSISTNTVNLSCASTTANLNASATGAASYTWIAPSPTGSIVSGNGTPAVVIDGPGIYTVVAIGSNGCSTSFVSPVTATVFPNANAPTFSISAASLSITCLNSNPQSVISTTATSIAWSPTVGISGTFSVNFSQAGTYVAVITDTNNGCTSNVNIVVSSNTNAPTASLSTVPTINCTNSVVTVSPAYTPSTGLSYSWTGAGITGPVNNSSVQSFTNLPLVVTFTDTNNGCAGAYTVTPNLSLSAPTLTMVTNTGSLNLSCSTPTLAYSANSNPSSGITYSWSTGATTPSINITNAGNYSVVATNTANGCSSVTNFSVGGGTSQPTINTAVNASISCGSTTTTLNASSSSTNALYNWNGPNIISGANSQNPVVGTSGIYTLVVTDAASGCSSTQTISVVNSSIVAQYTADVTSGQSPLNVTFTNTSIGATTYSWSFGNGAGSSQTDPSTVYNAPGNYTVVLLASNGACAASQTLEIVVKPALGIIPQIFTPNGDGHNDTFTIMGLLESYPNASLQVFNRWGNMVYSSKPYQNNWNGTSNVNDAVGSGKLPSGTYFYILLLNDKDNQVFRGYIELLY